MHLNFKQEEKFALLHNWGFYANGSLATCPLLTSLSKSSLFSNFGCALHLHLSHLDSLSPLHSSVVFKFPVFIFPPTCFIYIPLRASEGEEKPVLGRLLMEFVL